MPTIPSSGGLVPDGIWLTVGEDGKLTAGPSIVEMNERQLEQRNDIAGLRFAHDFNADQVENIFYDVFVDSSKISSQTNIDLTTGQNGCVQLGTASTPYNTIDTGNTYSADSWETVYQNNSVQNKKNIIDQLELKSSSSYEESGQIRVYIDGTEVFYRSDSSIDSSTGHTYNPDIEVNQGQSVLIEVYCGYVGGNRVYGRALIDEYQNASNGTITSVAHSQEEVAQQIQVEAEEQNLPSNTDYQIAVSDENDNTTAVSSNEIGELISTNFTGTQYTAEVQLTTSDTSQTPVIADYAINFIEGSS